VPELKRRDARRSFLDAQKRIPPLGSSCGNAGGAGVWRWGSAKWWEVWRNAIDVSEIQNSSGRCDGREFAKAASRFRPIWLSWLSCANTRRFLLAT